MVTPLHYLNKNLNHHLSFTSRGPWNSQSLCFIFHLEGNGNIPARCANEDNEAWDLWAEALLQTTHCKAELTGVMVSTAVNRDLCHLCPSSWHYWCGSQRLRLDMALGAAQSSHHPTALPLSLEQNRMAVAATPGLTSRDAKLELNYSPALWFPTAINAVTQPWQGLVTTRHV